MVQFDLTIGNTHKTLADGKHQWTLYTSASPLISSVVASLHPTFSPSVVQLQQTAGRHELSRVGWGTFEITLRVVLKEGLTLLSTGKEYIDVVWDLQFDSPDLAMVLPFELESSEAEAEAEAEVEVETHTEACEISTEADEANEAHLEQDMEGYRDALLETLKQRPFMPPSHPSFKHGRLITAPLPAPRCVWDTTLAPRDDHEDAAFSTAGPGDTTILTASEFVDSDEASRAKVRLLAELMKASKKTVLYTGAGISASVIGQAARSGTSAVKNTNPLAVKPTITHYCLGDLGRAGLISSWVQQNHDGLPQKAGYPQETLNEVHGSWYDPANPVVKYSGSLHSKAYPWMVEDAETADLVIVLGTSLGGLNADQVATNAAERSAKGAALGSVCLNLQQTPEDGLMSLRLFGKTDDILQALMVELGMEAAALRDNPRPVWPATSRVLVPYDAEGRLCQSKGQAKRKMWLDLRNGAKIRLSPGHNIQGAQQPAYMHIGTTCPDAAGYVCQRNERTCSIDMCIEGAMMQLGLWWLEVAMRGAVQTIPVVNLAPEFAHA